MKHVKLPLLFILLFSSFKSFAQEPKNELTLQLGLSGVARQDLIFSPFVHKNLTPIHIGLQFQRDAKFYHKAQLRFSQAKVKNHPIYTYYDDGQDFKTSPHYLTLVDINYNFGKNVLKEGKSKLIVGFDFHTDIQALNYVYGRFGSFGYHSTIGLGAFLNYNYKINDRHQIGSYVNLPIMYWFSRSPYLVNDDEFIENTYSHNGFKTFFSFIGDGKFVSLNRIQSLDWDIHYTYKISKRFDIGCSYLFEFIHASRDRELYSYRHSLFLNTSVKF